MYHVWTELFTKRPDLSKGGDYDGWQTIDAMPQNDFGNKEIKQRHKTCFKAVFPNAVPVRLRLSAKGDFTCHMTARSFTDN